MATYDWDNEKWSPGYAWARFSQVQEYYEKHKSSFPTPRHSLGDTVVFNSNDKVMRGTVERIVYFTPVVVPGLSRDYYLPYMWYEIRPTGGHILFVDDKDVI